MDTAALQEAEKTLLNINNPNSSLREPADTLIQTLRSTDPTKYVQLLIGAAKQSSNVTV